MPRKPTTPKPKAKPPQKLRPHEGTRLEYLISALAQLEAQVRAAEKDKSWTAAVQAKHKALQVRADIDQIRETERRQAPPASAGDHKSEILSEVRRLRQGATEAGSYVAAATLLRLEREFLTQTLAEERQANADELAQVEVDTLKQEISDLLARTPGARAPTH